MKQPECIIGTDGTKKWFLNGQLHREDGPAEELPDGTKRWFLNGKFHREDGPAEEWSNGEKRWCLNGQLHREDGPAVELSNGTKYWYLNGQLHREDGPAEEWPSGTKGWFLNGKRITTSPTNTHGLKVGDLVFIENKPAIVSKKTEIFIYFFLVEEEVIYLS